MVWGDYPAKDAIGKTVTGTIDRPIGSRHPLCPDTVYPVSYGFVDGVIAGDGDYQDAYVLGTDKPIQSFEGKVIALYHRLGDVMTSTGYK